MSSVGDVVYIRRAIAVISPISFTFETEFWIVISQYNPCSCKLMLGFNFLFLYVAYLCKGKLCNMYHSFINACYVTFFMDVQFS